MEAAHHAVQRHVSQDVTRIGENIDYQRMRAGRNDDRPFAL